MKAFRLHLPLLLVATGVYLAGCGTTSAPRTAQRDAANTTVVPPYKGGGYYKDDGPGANPPDNLDAIPDAVPRNEPLHAYANNPYKALDRQYTPLKTAAGYKAHGRASWYGRKFHGKPTSSGEPYDMYAMTAAHPTLPIPSYVRVTNIDSGKSVVVRVNDRGPFHDGRLIDLSYTAAYKLGVLKSVTPVLVEAVNADTPAAVFASEQTAPATSIAAPAPVLTAVAPPPAPIQVAAIAAPAPVVTPPVVEQALPAHYLQLGAFSSQTRANDMLERVTTRLSRTFPGVLRMSQDGLYKVQAGPFASREEATRAAAVLREEMGLASYKLVSEPRAGSAPQASAATPAVIVPGLYLQLAAVSSQEAAQAVGARARAKYGTELPGVGHVQSGSLYKVQAGPFADPAAADRLALAYQQDFGVKPYRISR